MGITISLKKKTKDDELILFPEAENLPPVAPQAPAGDPWALDHSEGQLAVDVYETESEVIIKSAIAGVKPEDLEVFVHNDMLTIRGTRPPECSEHGARHLVRECHWGSFSRSLILPSEIDAENIGAELKNGVLTVRLPKIERSKKIQIKGA
jgi:HSP20 family protein